MTQMLELLEPSARAARTAAGRAYEMERGLADIGGLRAAFHAYRTAAAAEPPSRASLAGSTEEQLFFLAFAQLWCTAMAPEVEMLYALQSRHAPPRARVNGAVAQVPEFAEAFACAADTPMNPADRCGV